MQNLGRVIYGFSRQQKYNCEHANVFYNIRSYRYTFELRHEKTCLQVRLKLACSATEAASMRLENLVTETKDITLSRQRITKALIRLRGCAG